MAHVSISSPTGIRAVLLRWDVGKRHQPALVLSPVSYNRASGLILFHTTRLLLKTTSRFLKDLKLSQNGGYDIDKLELTLTIFRLKCH